MTRIEELKIKKQAALIVVCTLGLAGVYQIQSFREIWGSNIFQGTSMSEKAGLGFVLKIISFLFLTILLAIPLFIIYLFRLIYYSIEISGLSRQQTDRENIVSQYRNQPMGIECDATRDSDRLDSFGLTYFYRENNQLYGPFTIYELVDLDIRKDTLLGINSVDNWCYAEEIDNLLNTLSLLSKLRDRRDTQNLR